MSQSWADQLRANGEAAAAIAEERKRAELAFLEGKLRDAAERAGKAWSGSNLGYQANVYYADLNKPPQGAHWSIEWGFEGTFLGSQGDWKVMDPDVIKEVILGWAGNPDLKGALKIADEAESRFRRLKEDAMSILSSYCSFRTEDTYIAELTEQVKANTPQTVNDSVRALMRTGDTISRDTRIMGQGWWPAPHQQIQGQINSILSVYVASQILADELRAAASHIDRASEMTTRPGSQVGTHVFIGHGRSHQWRILKDFVQDRARLPWEEFNRVPVAGVTNIQRLTQMLDSASIAFIVLTAEDEMSDGKVYARQNVVHEAGLFQGRLGFTRAIVMLEEGCEEFSNIQGLGQVRFPAGNISASFEEVRLILEREGIIPSS